MHGFFDTILDESFVSVGKPDPEIYTKTAQALGFDPAKCIVFEDSLSGVEAGKAAGGVYADPQELRGRITTALAQLKASGKKAPVEVAFCGQDNGNT